MRNDINTNRVIKIDVIGGNKIEFRAEAEKARLLLRGTGTITSAVSVDGVNWKSVSVEDTFSNGVVTIDLKGMIKEDLIKFEATTIISATIKY